MGGGQPERQRDESGAQVADVSQAERDRLSRLRLMGLALQLGGTIVGSLVVLMGGGIWLDRRFGTSPLFLLIGLVLAFVAIGYNLYELASVKTTPRKTTPKALASSATWDAWDDKEKDEDDDWPAQRGAGGKGKEG